ncbi:hypothetical protein L7F22_022031 [Adiantum nelumboides]|nr:hypothetical protein [Adiantum nelumboides]
MLRLYFDSTIGFLVGYTLFRTNFKSVEPLKEAESEKKEKEGETEKGSDKPKSVDTKSKTSEVTETEKGSDKPKSVDTKSETSEVTESKVSDASKSAVPESPKATLATQPVVQAINKAKPTDEEQQELYKWMLAEKRKINPTTKAEKAQNDAEKALLKEYLRGKNALNL